VEKESTLQKEENFFLTKYSLQPQAVAPPFPYQNFESNKPIDA
jgi:hypothetical protein